MSKYIIEIEEEPCVRRGENALYRAKGFNSLVFDQFGLDKLTPLDKELDEAYLQGKHDAEQDLARAAYDEAYQRGLDDAWEAVRKLYNYWYSNDDIFGDETFCGFIFQHSASEVIDRIKTYEEQQKADEIKVGDEVEAYSGRAIVFGTSTDAKGNKFCRYWYPSEDRFDKDKTENLKKTGRNFPQVAELIEAMKEGAK